MKKFKLMKEEDGLFYKKTDLFVGEAHEIKELYKRLEKRGNLRPLYAEFPRFNEERLYGLYIDLETRYFQVASSDTVLRMLLDGELGGAYEPDADMSIRY